MVPDVDPEEIAIELAETGLLNEEQAKVYVHRVLLHHSPQQTAGFLGMRLSTVDDRLESARDEVADLLTVFDALHRRTLVPVRRSPAEVWHRLDSAGCAAAPDVTAVAPHEERLAFEDDLDAFAGTLCEECFPAP